jgi:hypothetical protein
MCRRYADYIRACYATGARGLRVPIERAQWNARGTHLIGLGGRTARARPEPRCHRCGRAMIECRDRCVPEKYRAGEGQG